MVDLFRQVVFDCASDTVIQKLGFGSAIEIPVEIGCVIEDLDIPVCR